MGGCFAGVSAADRELERRRAELAREGDERKTGGNSDTNLIRAINKGENDKAALWIQAGSDLSLADKSGNTPLHRASRNGNVDIARLLILRRADVNAANATGQTALHAAAYFDKPDIAKLLLSKRANVHCQTELGVTPLDMAAAQARKGATKHCIDVIKKALMKEERDASREDSQAAELPAEMLPDESSEPSSPNPVKASI
eukprot:TRINITY_DN50352_c0_g1_i1.p1 TRINITY_DN50352_c0_g1~~TRINITY_DN50352_c0_g1_i1.p1  ORF type:complete len:201 (-),score=39.41 TRINITY_DN50352_c0_g1_i1:77-679(-)